MIYLFISLPKISLNPIFAPQISFSSNLLLLISSTNLPTHPISSTGMHETRYAQYGRLLPHHLAIPWAVVCSSRTRVQSTAGYLEMQRVDTHRWYCEVPQIHRFVEGSFYLRIISWLVEVCCGFLSWWLLKGFIEGSF